MKMINTVAKLIEFMISTCGLITPKKFEESMEKIRKDQSFVIGEYTLRNILVISFLFGGSYIYVPTLTTIYKWIRNDEIYRKYQQGTSTKDIALMYNIDRRRVLQIVKKRREMEEMKGVDRFVIEINISIKEKK
ncbi:Mor transcription activator family protein [Intestinibacter bartlettii]|uniref:Mor transcription activator domain-containing protein n=1 Tax=Intestinibacter bartlettii TaxID=261299 RepID=A0ABS6E1E0_9FIRM|nr:Mor transcription activator family protein [Intestinibacter bartlettii]MBU5337277.1 hypothetical protein [Intestinibacter bartlettii]